MDVARLKDLFAEFKSDAFRLETLPRYIVEEDLARERAFLEGEPLPTSKREDYCRAVSSATKQGKRTYRIHLLPPKLNSYLRYEIEWGYIYNSQAGEDIFLLPPSAPEETRRLATGDFWLFDSHILVLMQYDEDGRFTGAEIVEDEVVVNQYIKIRDQLMKHAITLRQFLAQYRKGEIG